MDFETGGHTPVGRTVGKGGAESLHGAAAATRRATSELLFFASKGDVVRCKILVNTVRELYAAEITECRDYQERTPLHVGAENGCYSVCQWLLEDEKVQVNPIDRQGRTPLQDAILGDFMEVAALLQSHGGQVLNKDGAMVESQIFNVKSVEEAIMREWEIEPSSLKMGRKIGEGVFGIVYKATWHECTVAVKTLKRSDRIAMDDFRTELDILQKCHHPNTVQFLGACTKEEPYMLVTEYMPCGSLADIFLRGAEHFPSIRRGLVIATDCAQALAYLHTGIKRMVIHRDLKPANILIGGVHAQDDNVKRIGAKYGVAKVADFGLSRITTLARTTMDLQQLEQRAMPNFLEPPPRRQTAEEELLHLAEAGGTSSRFNFTGETGTYRYMAPEVFRHEPYNSKADVYSFAMICYELFEGYRPFHKLEAWAAASGAAHHGRRPKWGKLNRFGKEIPEELKQLVQDCWAADIDARPDFVAATQRLHSIARAMAEDQGSEDGEPLAQPKCCSECSLQ